MFEPKYLILLDKKVFSSDQGICLGSQLKSIIENLNGLIKPHAWFCADVDACSPIPKKLGIDSFHLNKIGDNLSLIKLCNNIDQFLSGVFIAIREKNQTLKHSDVSLETEDEQFRSLDIDGVLIEIRTFDTSYFELYSEDIALMRKLSRTYGVKIETAD